MRNTWKTEIRPSPGRARAGGAGVGRGLGVDSRGVGGEAGTVGARRDAWPGAPKSSHGDLPTLLTTDVWQ